MTIPIRASSAPLLASMRLDEAHAYTSTRFPHQGWPGAARLRPHPRRARTTPTPAQAGAMAENAQVAVGAVLAHQPSSGNRIRSAQWSRTIKAGSARCATDPSGSI